VSKTAPESEGIIRYCIRDLRELLASQGAAETRGQALKIAKELAGAREPRRLFELLDVLDGLEGEEFAAIKAEVRDGLIGLYRSTVYRGRGWAD